MFRQTFIAAAALTALAATSASAATLSFVGTGQSQTISNNDLGLGLNGTSLDYITGDLQSASNGLSVSGPAEITFTYLGFEAGNQNYSASMGGGLFEKNVSTVGDSITLLQAAGGLIDFLFGTSSPQNSVGEIANHTTANPQSANYAIGYQMIDADSYYVFFDDIASGDRDFDDLAMRVDVAPVPLPAAGWMMIAGLGGIAAMRRKKK